MAIWVRRVAKVCLGVASVIAFGAGVGPKEAASNLSAWLNLLGVEQIPRWLSSEKADIYAFYISLVTILVCISIIGYPHLTRLWKGQAPKKTDYRYLAVEIDTTTPPNQALESWLEWLHVEVAPSPGAPPEVLIAWSNLDSLVHDMRWRSDHGPVEETTARAERPSILPIAIRSQRSETIMGTPVQAGVCYLTEVNFQINHLAAIRINAGVHQLFVMVRTRDNRDAMREFRLIVPPTLNEPLRIEPI